MNTSPTIEEMNKLAEEIADYRDKEKELANQKSAVTAELESRERRMTELMVENQLETYKSPSGTLSVSFRTSVKLPQGEQMAVWLDTLRKKYGSLEGAAEVGMLSTNSMRLNSFYKEEFELAKERGDVNFQIGGLTEIKISPTLSFRRSR